MHFVKFLKYINFYELFKVMKDFDFLKVHNRLQLKFCLYKKNTFNSILKLEIIIAINKNFLKLHIFSIYILLHILQYMQLGQLVIFNIFLYF